MRTDRDAGRKIRLMMQGKKADTFEAIQRALDPEMFEWTEEFNFGTVWTRPGLDFDDRILIAITALAVQGGPIRNYLHGAIQAGIDPMRIHETLVMLTPYAGFSVAMDALQVWGDVVRSERRRGAIVDCPVEDIDLEYKKPT
ncbi:MAG: carboxymuconolactone decarboxylase family protein [Pseudonocardia sp.]|uniref:carboxymuconolactone decarboxylase family protein n=1 Tax=unclassified Pseudonocardia TaxID=2619320 RepID=UPI001ACD9A13|nr:MULTISPECIES: carboxymuconolactone decarboxylase family protein [unclassified Pseudonocardia]MBN9112199.1 carboxymuconolactone decarboxylase family protein [Pseudonocardia sp.]